MEQLPVSGLFERHPAEECIMESLMLAGQRHVMRRQSGAVLFTTLVVLVLLTIATVSVIRAVDTSAVISGNYAFKQAAMQASDRAITDAMNNLANIVVGGGGNADQANRYSSLRLTPVDTLGVPTAINWSNVACLDEANSTCSPDTDNGKYRIQYYIERQCDAEPALADSVDIKTHCDYEITQATPEQIAIRYRIIIRVQGPRNATGMYEVMVSGPATS
jgi:Tfp pilus assembly protein PilX